MSNSDHVQRIMIIEQLYKQVPIVEKLQSIVANKDAIYGISRVVWSLIIACLCVILFLVLSHFGTPPISGGMTCLICGVVGTYQLGKIAANEICWTERFMKLFLSYEPVAVNSEALVSLKYVLNTSGYLDADCAFIWCEEETKALLNAIQVIKEKGQIYE